MIARALTYCYEFTSHIKIYSKCFKISMPLPHEFQSVENLSVVIVNNEIVVLGNYKLKVIYDKAKIMADFKKNPPSQDLE